jgi:hypothetical protein
VTKVNRKLVYNHLTELAETDCFLNEFFMILIYIMTVANSQELHILAGIIVKSIAMAHSISNANQSPEERRYLECVQKAEDFMKIEIYRSAKEWYSRAAEYNFNQEIGEKLDTCNRLIRQEKKRILVIVSVIAFVALAVVLLWK